jgi:hypothetical protein
LTKIDAREEKRVKNEAFADRFPRRDRKERRKARKERISAREESWLTGHGIPLDTESA